MARLDKDAMDTLKLVQEFIRMYGHDWMEDTFYPSYHFRRNLSLVANAVDTIVIRDARRTKRATRKPKEIPTT